MKLIASIRTPHHLELLPPLQGLIERPSGTARMEDSPGFWLDPRKPSQECRMIDPSIWLDWSERAAVGSAKGTGPSV